jgi:CitMHS family citrate-Mg2+:H+ or citrate-Ca2+:H+ symporter
MVAAVAVAWFLGSRESRRLGTEEHELVESSAVADRRTAAARGGGSPVASAGERAARPGNLVGDPGTSSSKDEVDTELGRPRLFWFNVALTVCVIGLLIAAVAPPELLFLTAAVIALVINYPGLKRQTARIEAHSKGAMLMATTLLAAGVFLGILEGSGMIDAMASTAAGALPVWAAPALPLIVGVLGVPLSLLFGPDAYYFGVMPVLIGVGEQFGVAGADIAQASLLGEETVGFPISPLTGSFFLLVGLGGVDIGRHIRHLIGWAWLVSLVMLVVAIVTGAVPLWVR